MLITIIKQVSNDNLGWYLTISTHIYPSLQCHKQHRQTCMISRYQKYMCVCMTPSVIYKTGQLIMTGYSLLTQLLHLSHSMIQELTCTYSLYLATNINCCNNLIAKPKLFLSPSQTPFSSRYLVKHATGHISVSGNFAIC